MKKIYEKKTIRKDIISSFFIKQHNNEKEDEVKNKRRIEEN
jgi:hypothetical protein